SDRPPDRSAQRGDGLGDQRIGTGLGLPRAAADRGGGATCAPRRVGKGAGMARIVFCEDEEQIRKLIEVAMRSTAHQIELHVNGRDGLEAIEREAPELIVTDLAMP